MRTHRALTSRIIRYVKESLDKPFHLKKVIFFTGWFLSLFLIAFDFFQLLFMVIENHIQFNTEIYGWIAGLGNTSQSDTIEVFIQMPIDALFFFAFLNEGLYILNRMDRFYKKAVEEPLSSSIRYYGDVFTMFIFFLILLIEAEKIIGGDYFIRPMSIWDIMIPNKPLF